MSAPLARLRAIMARLRSEQGCAWDRVQTFASIAPYTIEEAYEVADAIARGDFADLRGELGDLLFQVVFHAQMASEAGYFDFDAVAESICEKLVRRHPHVYADTSPAGGPPPAGAWEQLKAEERRAAAGNRSAGLLDGIALALPALVRTDKLGGRAARAGFDFPTSQQAADKVGEELAEVLEAAATQGPMRAARVFEEMGDLLFAAANLARKLDIDPENALRAANEKFSRRVRAMEALAASAGADFAALDLGAQERLWTQAKREESAEGGEGR